MTAADGKALYGRDYRIVVTPERSAGTSVLGTPIKQSGAYGFDVSLLRCQFKVKKTLKAEPNTAELKIFNLAENSRRVLENAGKLFLRLSAGYIDSGTSQIYFGEVRHAFTEWSGPTCVTTITTGDSEKEIAKNRIHVPVGPGLGLDVIIGAVVAALNVGKGNLQPTLDALKSRGMPKLYGVGSALSGNASRELTDLCRSVGIEWSIQDGNLQFLIPNKALNELALELSSESGLVGSPSITGAGLVKGRALLAPGFTPGHKVSFKSKSVTDFYRIEETEFSGDTHGQEWYADIACKTIS